MIYHPILNQLANIDLALLVRPSDEQRVEGQTACFCPFCAKDEAESDGKSARTPHFIIYNNERGGLYLSSRTVARFRERVFGFNQMLREKPHISLCDLRRIEQVINSYLGFFKNKRSYLLRKTTLSIFEHVFYEFFYIHGHFERIRLRNKCKMIQTSIL